MIPEGVMARLPGQFRIVHAWLEANGISEWLPERPLIAIDHVGGTLTYDGFVLREDSDRWSPADIVTRPSRLPDITRRTVPLMLSPSPSVRAALVGCGAELIEHAR